MRLFFSFAADLVSMDSMRSFAIVWKSSRSVCHRDEELEVEEVGEALRGLPSVRSRLVSATKVTVV